MVEESESYSDIEMDMPPKLTFEELRQQVMKDPPQARKRLDLLRTLYYYAKDSKKHSRIIKVLFWAMIVPLLQDTKNKQTALFGLKSLNQLITNESSHDQIIGIGKATHLQKSKNVKKMIKRAVQDENSRRPIQQFAAEDSVNDENMKKMNTFIESRQNPVRILASIILKIEPSNIMFEATKALRNLSRTEEVVDMLMDQNELLKIYKTKILGIDTHSQENILMTISAACKKKEYRQRFVEDDEFIETLLSQIKSVSKPVTLQTLRICRQLAKDEHNLMKLQGDNLRLSRELIYAFQWLDAFINQQEEVQRQPNNASGHQMIRTDQNQAMEKTASGQEGDEATNMNDLSDQDINDAIYREISKAFEYILKYYDLHKRQIETLIVKNLEQINSADDTQNTENQIIETIVQLGRSTRDLKTTLNAATSLAHITEVLDCNKEVATDDAIDFMIDMLKDTKNVKHHRQGCRYFANLSFYRNFRDNLIRKEIATFLLKAIEGHLEQDTIKHAAIALANLSSHKDFMKSNHTVASQQNSISESALSSKAEKWMIKPLIHILDSAQDQKIDLIQSACITLCNMASKPHLHKHFVHEPEISTFKNCLADPIDKGHGNELTRFMIKLVCNLTKNPEVLPHLLQKGYLEILFKLLNHEREKEIFGNVVTAIAYLSVHEEAQEQIKRNNIIPKILEPLTQIHQVDQKMIIIAITSMLFNGTELQKEFIKHNGLGKLLFFLQQKDKIFYQLACKCFSLLSESEEILNKIIDQECLNTIIISCLRSKDIDLETLKEITKIFINLILWGKLKAEIVETTCCLCDIGLMIDDLDMNILAMFCLNSLSEDEEHHEKIIQQGASQGVMDKLQHNKDNTGASSGAKNKAKGNDSSSNQGIQSIFPRINYLLKHCKQDPNCEKIDSSKRELLITLITSFYLNLARNKNNRDFLLKLELFRNLSNLMLEEPDGIENKTALCYTNTIFSKLLKYQQSRINCMNEEGYRLFISILKDNDNKHLFLEALDCIKLFLMTRTNLEKFREIPKCIQLDEDCPELNVSFLQVLAILSFEKQNHGDLKTPEFIKKLNDAGMFKATFDHFDKLLMEEKNAMEQFDQHQKIPLGGRTKPIMTETSQMSLLSQSGMQSPKTGNRDKRNYKSDLNRTRQVELALAISIIFSNLSNDEEYIRILLGVDQWWKRFCDDNGHDNSLEGEAQENMCAVNFPFADEYTTFMLQQKEVKRITGLFNLLSHPDPFISEQISILLANVSNSQYFKYQFLTDRSMKSIIKILRFKSKSTQTEVSLLAILITILNLSAMKDVVKGIENMNFLESLETIIQNTAKPLEQRSIALMAISNIFTQSRDVSISDPTQDFAFTILRSWKHMRDVEKQNEEVIKNLVYASLILFYNLLLQIFAKSEVNAKAQQQGIMEKLIDCLNNHIMDDFKDHMIVNVVLHLITLFTKNAETAKILFNNNKILAYIFNKLQYTNVFDLIAHKEGVRPEVHFQETIKLATLALSRLSSKFDKDTINPENFIIQLKEFDDFKYMLVNYIANGLKKNRTRSNLNEESKGGENGEKNNHNSAQDHLNNDFSHKQSNLEENKTFTETLKYLLNILENITSVDELREVIDCSQLFEWIKVLFTESLDSTNKKSLINIMFNLNFKMPEPAYLSFEFLKLLYKTYTEADNIGDSQQNAIQRKMISIVVVASAKESNHDQIIKSNFYTQFKRNINDDYQTMQAGNEEIELFGLVNIALNKHKMDKIYMDLKKIHKIAIKNDKIDFKTKVDLFVEVSKYIAKISSKQQLESGKGDEHEQENSQNEANNGVANINSDKEYNVKVQESLKALIYTMVRLTQQLDETNFMMYKYFLLAILDCTRNLKNHLKYLIKIKKILEFLRKVLQQKKSEFEFEDKDFTDQQVLVFSLKMIVCEIFFNLKFEKEFFKLHDISDAVGLLIEFSQQVLQMSIEKKTQLVSNTLRLLSQMITTIHQMDNAGEILAKTNAIQFVKQSLQLSRDLQPCINIDALFCLNNMMNVQQIAESPELCNMETLFNAFAIYFAFNDKIALDECLITYLFSISKIEKYQGFLKDKSKVLFKLLERHLDANSETQLPSCRQKLFSTFHNLTQRKEICQSLDIEQFIQKTNFMLKQTSGEQRADYPSDNIHELAMKTLINLCRHSSEAMLEGNLKELLEYIAKLYIKFTPLAKQYALRLVTILTSEWTHTKMEPYLVQIIKILGEFINHYQQSVEIKLVLINLEKIASHKALMKKLAEIDNDNEEKPAQLLIAKIASFLDNHDSDTDYEECTEQLLRFCKKMSQQSQLQDGLYKKEMHRIALNHIQLSQSSLDLNEQDDVKLKSHLQTVQNVMKMVKNLFEGAETEEVKHDIVQKVEANRELVDKVNNLLASYKGNDDMAVMIVKIISCFNSISNNMDKSKVEQWIEDFSGRLIEAAKPNVKQGSQQSYMERYVFIIELLVTKNLEKIEKDITQTLLKIYESPTTNFSKTIWYKMLKILAHLLHLQDIMVGDHKIDKIDQMFGFILKSQNETKESLSFLYFMRVTMLLTKKFNNDELFKRSANFRQVLDLISFKFNENKLELHDDLIKEIVLYQIDYSRFLMNYKEIHVYLNQKEVVSQFILMLKHHTDKKIVKALSIALKEASNTTQFYPDLLSDNALNTILMKILDSQTQQDSLEPLYDCLNSVMNKTKAPIKYLLATSVLKMTESEHFSTCKKEEPNILFILKVLQSNLKSLDQRANDNLFNNENGEESKGEGDFAIQMQSKNKAVKQKEVIAGGTQNDFQEQFKGLRFKAHKYCLLAMTNILIKTNCEYIFTRKHKLVPLDELFQNDRTNFESDPQMNLRFLTLINIAFKKESQKEDRQEQTFEEKKLKDLIDNILNNIYKFRNILDSKESYFIQIPKLNHQAMALEVDENLSQLFPEGLDFPANQDEHAHNQVLSLNRLKTEQSQLQQKSSDMLRFTSQKNYNPRSQIMGKRDTLESVVESNNEAASVAPENRRSTIDFNSKNNLNMLPVPEEETHIKKASTSCTKFFFEESQDGTSDEPQQLTKGDAIRISLCLSVKALYQMTKKKKRYACIPIIENEDELKQQLFKFFTSYVRDGDKSTIKYVRKVIKILQNCSEVNSLCKSLLSMEVVTHLTDVANRVLHDEFGQDTIQVRESILLPILKTFEQLNQGEMLELHLQRQNMLSMISKINSQDDEIRALCLSLEESLMGPEDQDNQNFSDIAEQIQSISEEEDQKQLDTLKVIENALRNKQIILDKIENQQLGILIQLYQKQLLDEYPAQHQQEIMAYILKILCFVYEHKYSKGLTAPSDMLLYRNDVNQVFNKNHKIINEMGQTAIVTNAEFNPPVPSAIDLKETFETFYATIHKPGLDNEVIVEHIIQIFSLYSQTQHKQAQVANEYILPCLQTVSQKGPSEMHSGIARFSKILDCLLYFLQMKEDKLQILSSFDVTQLLLSFVSIENLFLEQIEMLKKLEDIVKAVFRSPGVLQPSGEQFVKFLLKHSRHDFNRLGILSLYCIALGLPDKTGAANISIFNDEKVLSSLILFAKDKSGNMSSNNPTQQKMVQRSDSIANASESQELQKLRIVAMQIIVIICEFQGASLIKEKQSEIQGSIKGKLTSRIFMNYGLLNLLIRKCLNCQNEDLTLDEVRLIARAFSALPIEVIVQEDIPIFDRATVYAHEQRLQEDANNNPSKKIPFNRGKLFKATIPEINLMSILTALANIVSHYKDPSANYFAMYTALNLIYTLNLKSPTVNGQSSISRRLSDKGPIDLSQINLSDMDYQMLTSCLLRSRILELALIQPTLVEADSDIMRVCIKLVITLVFKASKKRILMGQVDSGAKLSNQLSDLYKRLDLDFVNEKRNSQELLSVFVAKLHAFEIQNIQKDGYVHFIHLISQIVLHTSIPVDSPDERLRILPTQGILRHMIQSWSESMDEDKINEILNKNSAEATGSDHKKGKKQPQNSALSNTSEAGSAMKMLLYKFFFFNYVFQVTGSDIIEGLMSGEPQDPLQQYGRDFPPIAKPEKVQQKMPKDQSAEQRSQQLLKENGTILGNLVRSLVLVVQTLRSRKMNVKFDQAIKPFKQSSKIVASVKVEQEERKDVSQDVDAVQGAPVTEEEKLAAEEEDQRSTSLSIVKMSLYNLQTTLQKILESDMASQFNFVLQRGQLEAFESLVTDYEENGDIVEPCYVVLDRLLRLCNTPEHETIKVMDHSKDLLRQAIKHSAQYQCQESYTFLCKLISSSTRFKNKTEMEQAMLKIAPPQMQNTDLEHQTTYLNSPDPRDQTAVAGQSSGGVATAPPANAAEKGTNFISSIFEKVVVSGAQTGFTNSTSSRKRGNEQEQQQDSQAPPQDTSQPQ